MNIKLLLICKQISYISYSTLCKWTLIWLTMGLSVHILVELTISVQNTYLIWLKSKIPSVDADFCLSFCLSQNKLPFLYLTVIWYGWRARVHLSRRWFLSFILLNHTKWFLFVCTTKLVPFKQCKSDSTLPFPLGLRWPGLVSRQHLGHLSIFHHWYNIQSISSNI